MLVVNVVLRTDRKRLLSYGLSQSLARRDFIATSFLLFSAKFGSSSGSGDMAPVTGYHVPDDD